MTSRSPKKAGKKSGPKTKKLSNPTSTGGGGTSFESRVQASRLLAMCLGHPSPGDAEGRIVELKFQARIHGHHTDDLVCVVDGEIGQRRRLLLQMKRTLAPRLSNAPFVESVIAAWTDYSGTDFTRGQDSIFIVYDNVCAAAMKGMATVCDWARYAVTAAEFVRKVDAEGFSNVANRTALATLRAIFKNHAGHEVSDDEVHEFAKHLHLQSHDLDQDGTTEHMGMLGAIKHAAKLVGEPTSPQDIWSRLVTACMTANSTAATITFANLVELIGSRLSGMFSASRDYLHGTYGLSAQAPAGSPAPNIVAAELARLSGLVAAMSQARFDSASQDQLPRARPDSQNKFVTIQLDGIHDRIRAFRYADAMEELSRIEVCIGEFDVHQQARFFLLRGTCRWHLEAPEAAAADLIRSAELCPDEDKFAAAGVRGLLLQEKIEEAAKAGDDALRRFPTSLSVWLATANAKLNLDVPLSLDEQPDSIANAAEAMQLLAWSHHKRGDKAEAARTALRALDADSPNYFTRNTALSMCLDRAAGDSISSVFQMLSEEDRAALSRCVDEFGQRETTLWRIQSPSTVAATASNLAAAYLQLGRPKDALVVLTEARAHQVSTPHLLRLEFAGLAATDQNVRAIELGRSRIAEMPKETLATFAQIANELEDLETIDLCIAAAERLQTPEPGLVSALRAMRSSALASKNLEAAVEEVARLDAVNATIPELVSASQILRQANDLDRSNKLIDLAAARINEASEAADRYFVARALFFSRRHDEAAVYYEQIAPLGKHSSLHADLLYCYIQTGRRAKARELINAFPPGWEQDTNSRRIAIDLGFMAGDWPLITRMAEVERAQFPRRVRSWLLRVMIAIRQRGESVAEAIAGAPLEMEGTVREIAQFASIELRNGFRPRGIKRLYVMRRRRLDSSEVAAAHLVSHVGVEEPLQEIHDVPETVEAGTSVVLHLPNGMSKIFTVDPSGLPALPATAEFLPPDDSEAKALVGLKVGDELPVASSPSGETFVVASIATAYRRLLELSQVAIESPLTPTDVVQLRMTRDPETGALDVSELTRRLQRSSKRSTEALNVYKTAPLTLGGFARVIGRDIFDVVRGWPSDGPPLHVSGGSQEERTEAISSLDSEDRSYIVDAATLTELALLDSLPVLGTLPRVLVTSQTRDMIEAKLMEADIVQTKGTAFEQDGKLGIVERTEADRARDVSLYQSIVYAMKAHAQVVPAYGVDAQHKAASQFRALVSAEELSVLLAADEHQATLISVDARLRLMGTEAFAIKGIWPQALLAHARDKGSLNRRTYSIATVRMLIGNRSFVSVSAEDLTYMCYQGSSWVKIGLPHLKRHLSGKDILFNSGYGVALEFFVRLVLNGPCHIGAARIVLTEISEALHRHPDAPSNLQGRLYDSINSRISLAPSLPDVPLAQLFRDAIRQGREAAKSGSRSEIAKVVVLNCSEPPCIAFMPEGEQVASQQDRVLSPTEITSSQGAAVDSPTSGAGVADNPFR